jgi:hypothetical protein
LRKHFTTLQGFNLKEGALPVYSRQRAEGLPLAPRKGLKRKARTTTAGRRRTCRSSRQRESHPKWLSQYGRPKKKKIETSYVFLQVRSKYQAIERIFDEIIELNNCL